MAGINKCNCICVGEEAEQCPHCPTDETPLWLLASFADVDTNTFCDTVFDDPNDVIFSINASGTALTGDVCLLQNPDNPCQWLGEIAGPDVNGYTGGSCAGSPFCTDSGTYDVIVTFSDDPGVPGKGISISVTRPTTQACFTNGGFAIDVFAFARAGEGLSVVLPCTTAQTFTNSHSGSQINGNHLTPTVNGDVTLTPNDPSCTGGMAPFSMSAARFKELQSRASRIIVPRSTPSGLGDTVAKVLHSKPLQRVFGPKPCSRCEERRRLLNSLLPFRRKS